MDSSFISVGNALSKLLVAQFFLSQLLVEGRRSNQKKRMASIFQQEARREMANRYTTPLYPMILVSPEHEPTKSANTRRIVPERSHSTRRLQKDYTTTPKHPTYSYMPRQRQQRTTVSSGSQSTADNKKAESHRYHPSSSSTGSSSMQVQPLKIRHHADTQKALPDPPRPPEPTQSTYTASETGDIPLRMRIKMAIAAAAAERQFPFGGRRK
jgi:hypothetical protein